MKEQKISFNLKTKKHLGKIALLVCSLYLHFIELRAYYACVIPFPPFGGPKTSDKNVVDIHENIVIDSTN
jgi:hypothetical protein